MTLSEINLLESLTSIKAAYTLRGKATDNPYSEFNTCHYTGDSPEHIAACRSALIESLGGNVVLATPRQTHSTNVAVIDSLPVGDLPDTDAIVTSLKGVALCIHTADCVPIVLADTETGVIGAAHSGWRGTVANIAAATVAQMIKLGANPENIHAAMGPCICTDCFEVGEEVAKHFPNHTHHTKGEKPHVDLAEAVRSQLISAGIPKEHITMPLECSHCNPDHLFSARTLGINSGRTLTYISQK